MPVTVWIPPVLRRLAGGRDELEAGGATVAEALAGLQLGEDSLSLLERLAAGRGLLPPLNLFVNGTDVRAAQGLHTPLRPGDEIAIVPSIAGGR